MCVGTLYPTTSVEHFAVKVSRVSSKSTITSHPSSAAERYRSLAVACRRKAQRHLTGQLASCSSFHFFFPLLQLYLGQLPLPCGRFLVLRLKHEVADTKLDLAPPPSGASSTDSVSTASPLPMTESHVGFSRTVLEFHIQFLLPASHLITP